MLLSHLSICFGYFCCRNFFAVFEGYKVGYDLNGERMPELRSGARRSKWLGDLQTGALAVNQGVNWAEPAQNRTRRRVGAGRGGNATGLGKGSSPPQDELQLVEAAEQD
ncbi:casein kinase protein HD16 [Trifolium repens]|jgi:hypothetical protein|nr:casein kinase protein HD16 [Trifolium repens]